MMQLMTDSIPSELAYNKLFAQLKFLTQANSFVKVIVSLAEWIKS